jgi:hypothetical protein
LACTTDVDEEFGSSTPSHPHVALKFHPWQMSQSFQGTHYRKNKLTRDDSLAFVSSSAIEKEIELKTVEIITIENIKITRTLSIITNTDSHKSKAFDFFYTELWLLKNL